MRGGRKDTVGRITMAQEPAAPFAYGAVDGAAAGLAGASGAADADASGAPAGGGFSSVFWHAAANSKAARATIRILRIISSSKSGDRSPGVFGHNLPTDRSENNSLIGSTVVSPLKLRAFRRR
jgi:hypothetical protein